jgi:hypothetical protein
MRKLNLNLGLDQPLSHPFQFVIHIPCYIVWTTDNIIIIYINTVTSVCDVMIYRKDLFNVDIFRKLVIRVWLQLLLFLLIPSQKLFLTKKVTVKNGQCCPKRRPREAHRFRVLPLASDWGRTVDFDVFVLFTRGRRLPFRYLHVVCLSVGLWKKLPSIGH